MERSAAAQVSAIPDQPADDGFFGPGSVAWRLSGDLSGVIAGLRALLLQAVDPLAWPALTSTATGAGTRSGGWPPPRPTPRP